MNNLDNVYNKLAAKTLDEAKKKPFNFWKTQPVTNINDVIGKAGEIKKIDVTQISTNPFILPDKFKWGIIDPENDSDLSTLEVFLNKYYVSDLDDAFRLNYTKDTLKLLIMNPRGKKDYNVCMWGTNDNGVTVLVGFITGYPMKHQACRDVLDMLEVNLLCVTPTLRLKNMASLLIKELTRKANLDGYTQAFFSSSRYVPKPFFSAKYFHRILNVDVALSTKFTQLEQKSTQEDMEKYYQLDSELDDNFKKMEESHLQQACEILNKYLDVYHFHPIFNQEQFNHYFYNNNVVTSYVLCDDDNNVLDFISYYQLDSNVLQNNSKYNKIKTCYLFYYTSNEKTSYRLIKDMMIVAHNNGFDMFNTIDIMEHNIMLQELGFSVGTGVSNYYLWNWQLPDMKNAQIGKNII